VGTASLIAGIGLMMIGFAVIAQGFLGTYFTTAQFFDSVLFNVIIGIPLIVLGAYFLKQYDIAKKKEAEPKKDIQYKTQPEWNLKKSLILRGVIMGIIASLIIWGALPALTYQSYVMTSDAMEPTIMEGDRVSYAKTPFSQISVNDIIAFTDQDDSSRVLVNKVVRVYGNVVEATNEESSIVRIVTEDEYIGKINSIEAVSGLLSVLLIPYLIFFLMAVAFVTPIVIMSIVGGRRNSKNS